MDLEDLRTWADSGRSFVGLARDLIPLLPRGQTAAAETQLQRVEQALARSNAQLAKELGYKLCQCSFPPQIMLWQQAREAWVCPSPACGRAICNPRRLPRRVTRTSWMSA